MTYFTDTFRTPFGEFTIAVDEQAVVTASAFGAVDALRGRFRCDQLQRDASVVRTAREQILAYAAGERAAFTVPVAPAGTAFQRRVWSALQAIPLGTTRTYRELASAIGNPAAARAVGRANATNPICLLIPCHRVIGSNGSLTGFAFGEAIKRQLLEHEKAWGVARGNPAAA